MRAITVSRFGGPEVLQIQESVRPQPQTGQVLIKVAYTSVNYADVLARRTGYRIVEPPFIPGLEVAGTIEELGENVQGLYIGQPVAAFVMVGGYAEYAVAQAALTFPLDNFEKPVDLAVAAAFPTIGITAYDLLVHAGHLRQGETILIHAAAGGVGTLAASLARHLGADRIIGTVGSRAKIAYAQAAGYDHVFLRENFVEAVQEVTQGRGVDLVLDAAGGTTRSQSLALLAPFGRLLVFGNASGQEEPSFSPAELRTTNRTIAGYSISTLSQTAPAQVAASAHEVLALLSQGQISIDITETLPLEQAARAHQLIESSSFHGKIVLQVE